MIRIAESRQHQTTAVEKVVERCLTAPSKSEARRGLVWHTQGSGKTFTMIKAAELLFKAAQIYEEVLENADRAIDVYRQVMSLDENDRNAIDALERLYIRLERWAQLKDIYAKKAELAQNPEEKKQMLFVLGQVYDRELKDLTRAIETYQTILEVDNPDLALRPGMTATASIQVAHVEHALLVPNAALRFVPPTEERRHSQIGRAHV